MLYVYFKTMAAHFFVIHGNRYSGMREQVAGTRDRMFLVLTPRYDTRHTRHMLRNVTTEAHRKSPVRLDAPRGRGNGTRSPPYAMPWRTSWMNSSGSISLFPSVSTSWISAWASASVISSPVTTCIANLSSPACKNPSPDVSYPGHTAKARGGARARVCVTASLSRARAPVTSKGEMRRGGGVGWGGDSTTHDRKSP
jgi:hypothetical protein